MKEGKKLWIKGNLIFYQKSQKLIFLQANIRNEGLSIQYPELEKFENRKNSIIFCIFTNSNVKRKWRKRWN